MTNEHDLQHLRMLIKEGDDAYARGEFTPYTQPGLFADELKAKLRQQAEDQP